jgi:hypothetical protein
VTRYVTGILIGGVHDESGKSPSFQILYCHAGVYGGAPFKFASASLNEFALGLDAELEVVFGRRGVRCMMCNMCNMES